MHLRSSIDGGAKVVELSKPAVQLSQTLTTALEYPAGDAPVPVSLEVPIGAAELARVAALLERTVAVVEGAPEKHRAVLREQGLLRAAALDDGPDAATQTALASLGDPFRER